MTTVTHHTTFLFIHSGYTAIQTPGDDDPKGFGTST